MRTTIDPLLQRQVEALLQREAAALDPQATLAALVVDNRDRATSSPMSATPISWPAARHGTIDMARAVRSPGSALKPFIYAMAFDRLIIHPETMLDDQPRHFGDYAPGDFDGRFLGEVSAREALQYSLNVPAVAVLDRLGPGRFTAALAAAGIRLQLPQPTSEPGLAIALGGDGISSARSRDALRRAVAWRRGRAAADPARPAAGAGRRRSSGRSPPGTSTTSSTAAPPPPGMLPAEVRRARQLAFKTGTSYGFRDAWAVGYDSRGDDRGLGRTARRHADAGHHRPHDRGAGAVQDRRSARPRRSTRARRRRRRVRCWSPAGTCRLACGASIPAPAERGGRDRRRARRSSIRLTAPIVDWHGEEVPLEAAGGSGPLRWLADGRPLPPGPPRKELFWSAGGIGFARAHRHRRRRRSARPPRCGCSAMRFN